MASAPLKPFTYRACPFCHGEPELFEDVDQGVGYEPNIYYVYCQRCKSRGPWSFNAQEAVSQWNKRHIKKKYLNLG